MSKNALRIMIIGNSGSGKSTLAHALGKHLGVPVVHLDEWGHEELDGNILPSDKEKRNQRILTFLENTPSWIFDGDWDHTTSAFRERCLRATHIFFLDVSSPKAVYRAVKRAIGQKKGRHAVGNVHKGHLSWNFLFHWIWKYKKVHAPAMLSHVYAYAPKKLHRVRSYHDVLQKLAL